VDATDRVKGEKKGTQLLFVGRPKGNGETANYRERKEKKKLLSNWLAVGEEEKGQARKKGGGFLHLSFALEKSVAWRGGEGEKKKIVLSQKDRKGISSFGKKGKKKGKGKGDMERIRGGGGGEGREGN